MSRPTVLLDLASDNQHAKDLAAGGVFVPGCTLKLDQDCDLIVRAGAGEVRVAARVVFVDPARGAGLELVQCSAETKQKIAALARTVGTQAPTITVDALTAAAAAERVRAGRDKLAPTTGAPPVARVPTPREQAASPPPITTPREQTPSTPPITTAREHTPSPPPITTAREQTPSTPPMTTAREQTSTPPIIRDVPSAPGLPPDPAPHPAPVFAESPPPVEKPDEPARPPERKISSVGRAKIISGGHPAITRDPGDSNRMPAVRMPADRSDVITGTEPTIMGDRLAVAAAAANVAAGPEQPPHDEVTRSPTVTGDALAEATHHAVAAAGTRPDVTGTPTITGDALAAAAATALAESAIDGYAGLEDVEKHETQNEADETESHASQQADTDEDLEAVRHIPPSVHERLRGLTLVQQIKLAHHGELHERIILERMYGKSVWEALLRNPKITGHEVARIARMATLPRTLIEVIVNNGTWLQVPEVRRALLANHRLGPDQIMRILRLLPKLELKLAGTQTAYSFAVRDAARRLIRGGD